MTLNDTLKLTNEQGFPAELNLEKHLISPFSAEDFTGKMFSFTNKPTIRIYQQVPVRNFLVQYLNGKRIYRGLVHILEITSDYQKKTTSGSFEILYIYTPEQMKMAHSMIDRNVETDYFN